MNKKLQFFKTSTFRRLSLREGFRMAFILFLSLGISTTIYAQTAQSNFINYQGIASNAAGEVMANETITVGITLRYATTGAAEYAEKHIVTTDANGVFSLKIGNGDATTSSYNTFQWPGIAVFLTTSINGTEIGTTEFLAVPYAINAGNTYWVKDGDKIENTNLGLVEINNDLEVGGNFQLNAGASVNEISIDGTLVGNSDEVIPTEKAVKMYIDANGASGLEKITQDGKTGWRLIGVDPLYYGNIGTEAVDLSITYDEAGPTGGATGTHSVALGAETTASGTRSTAMGYHGTASGTSSTAIGHYTIASGDTSIAMGQGSRAFGNTSIAMGWETDSYGKAATSMGNKTIALGNSSTAMGFETSASGSYSTSMGDETTASGDNSTSMGYSTVASGKYSTSMGSYTGASGEFSTSMGQTTKAQSYNSLAIGKKNIGGGSADSWVLTDPLFEIGNGVSSDSNALTVLKNGKVGIGEHKPTAALEIKYNSSVTSGHINLKEDGADFARINFYNSNRPTNFWAIAGLVGNTNADDRLNFYNSVGGNIMSLTGNGNVLVNNAVIHSSDRRLKKDITELPYGLKEVLQLHPVSYYWKNRQQNYKSIGLIAQEVAPIIKELVHTDSDKDKTLSLSYTELVPILIKAIQEQQTIIDGQNTKIEGLSAEVSTTKKDLANILTRVIAMEKEKIATN